VRDTSFVKNVAAGVDAMGVQYAPLVYTLAKVRWDSAEDRDAVLRFLSEDVDG